MLNVYSTNCMEQSSSEVDSHSTDQEISYLLWNPYVQYCYSNGLFSKGFCSRWVLLHANIQQLHLSPINSSLSPLNSISVSRCPITLQYLVHYSAFQSSIAQWSPSQQWLSATIFNTELPGNSVINNSLLRKCIVYFAMLRKSSNTVLYCQLLCHCLYCCTSTSAPQLYKLMLLWKLRPPAYIVAWNSYFWVNTVLPTPCH
jgi:hypothetical protein